MGSKNVISHENPICSRFINRCLVCLASWAHSSSLDTNISCNLSSSAACSSKRRCKACTSGLGGEGLLAKRPASLEKGPKQSRLPQHQRRPPARQRGTARHQDGIDLRPRSMEWNRRLAQHQRRHPARQRGAARHQDGLELRVKINGVAPSGCAASTAVLLLKP